MIYNKITSYKEKRLKDQKGATAVELALIITFVFLPLLFGIIELGLLVYNQHIITNATREGARAGVVYRTNRIPKADIEDVVKNYAENNLITFSDFEWNNNMVDVKNIDDHGENKCINSGDRIQITLSYTYDYLLLKIFLDPTDMESETIMVCE